MHRKNSSTFTDLGLPLLISSVPAVMQAGVNCISKRSNVTWKDFFLTGIIYCVSAFITYIIYQKHQRIKKLSIYEKYTGQWIQYIPSFSRQFAICKLSFDGDEFHFDGDNVTADGTKDVHFVSKRFVADTDNSFFYVTSANQPDKPLKIEGFGKVYDLAWDTNGILEGAGYFFDVTAAYYSATGSSTNRDKALLQTFVFKHDASFYRHFGIPVPKNIERMTNMQIFEKTHAVIENYCSEKLWNYS